MPEQIQKLEEIIRQQDERIKQLEAKANMLYFSDKYLFSRDIELEDQRNFIFSGVTGNKIGTSSTQKLSFYGASPIVRPSSVPITAGDIHDALSDLGLIT